MHESGGPKGGALHAIRGLLIASSNALKHEQTNMFSLQFLLPVMLFQRTNELEMYLMMLSYEPAYQCYFHLCNALKEGPPSLQCIVSEGRIPSSSPPMNAMQ